MWSFFIILLYILGNIFIAFRVLSWLKAIHKPLNHKIIQFIFLILYSLCAVTPIVAFLLPISPLQRSLQIFANNFMGVYIYMFMMALIFCVIYLLFKMIFQKQAEFFKARKYLYTTCCITLCFVISMSVYGMFHAHHITVKHYDATIKQATKEEEFKIVLFADLHLGYNVGVNTIQKVVEKSNQEQPDLIFIAGDIFDNNYDAVKDPDKIIAELKKLKATHGIYAVFGNHDVTERLFGGFSVQSIEQDFRDPRMEEFLMKADIKILDDEVVTIADSFHLIGRLDAKKAGDGTRNRKSVKNLSKGYDDLPLVVLEHEPKNLEESRKEKVQLHLAGHTHDGQFFPLNIFCKLLYENSYGLQKKDNMTSIVTSGVGVYGPNMRVGTNSEIVSINLKLEK